jgi:translocation and assembly module TamA
MNVTYTLDPGPAMHFGPAAISGLDRLDAAYVEHRIRWRQGETYDNRSVDDTRKALVESGLFSTVRITPVADPADPTRARINVEAEERAHRTIGAGLAYNTSEGADGRVFWENRNLFGEAEYLRLSLALGQQKNGVAANFRRPDFLDVDLDLLALAEIADDTPTAYHSRRARVSAGLERRFDRILTGGIALGVEKGQRRPACQPQLRNSEPAHPALRADRAAAVSEARQQRRSLEPDTRLSRASQSGALPELFRPQPDLCLRAGFGQHLSAARRK